MKYSILSIALLVTGAVLADAPVADMLKSTGLKNGIVAVWQDDQAAIARQVTAAGEWLVHCRVSDDSLMKVRAALVAKGLLNRRIYVDPAEAARLPFPDEFVDILLVDAQQAKLDGVLVSEVLRVLAPWRGQALVFGASQAALQKWLSEAKVPEKGVRTIKGMPVACLRQAPLKNADDWTHRMHGPDNNPMSHDTAFHGPYAMQWTERPMLAQGFQATTLVSTGRLFSLGSDDVFFNRKHIRCRSMAGGRILWEREPPKYSNFNLPTAVATPECLWLFDGPDIIALDAETGEERKRFKVPNAGTDGLWLVLQDSVLYAGWGTHPGKRKEIGKRGFDYFLHAKTLAALDSKNGSVRWKIATNGDIDPRSLCLSDGVIVAYNYGKELRGYSAQDGKILWTQSDRKTIEGLSTFKKKISGFENTMGAGKSNLVTHGVALARAQPSVIAANGVVVFCQGFTDTYTMFDIKTGKRLWSTPSVAGASWNTSSAYIDGDSLVTSFGAFDLRSGKKVTDLKVKHYYCGPISGAPGIVLTGNGPSTDVKTGEDIMARLNQTMCEIPSIISDGRIVLAAGKCSCSEILLYGDQIYAPMPKTYLEQPSENALVFSNTAKNLLQDRMDWPTARADNARSNATKVAVSKTGQGRWIHSSKVPFNVPPLNEGRSQASVPDDSPTAPVAVGNLVVYAQADGSVTAIDLRNGATLWQFQTGGYVYQAPAIAEGRVIVGAGDGMVHALEAVSGRELWRFRIGPVERRIMVYGHLVSTWAPLAGPLIQDNVVYVAGGITAHSGTRVFALDLATGTIRWQNVRAGQNGSKPEDGVRVAGHLTITDKHLFLAADGPRYAAFDLKTGQLQAPDSYDRSGLRGRQQGVLPGGWLLQGGEQNFVGYERRFGSGRGADLALSKLDESGLPDGPHVRLSPSGPHGDKLLSAWDETAFVISRLKRYGVELWSMDSLMKKVSAAREKGMNGKRRKDQILLPQENVKDPLTKPTEPAQWPGFIHPVAGVALGADAIVIAHCDNEPHRKGSFHNVQPQNWFVTVLERSSGKERWRMKLPVEPIKDGLAIARDGSVLCTLRDGSIICIGGK